MADLAHLQAVAAQLAARVRDDDPDANAAWLLAALPDENDRFALHFVSSAAIPVDRTWSELVAWVNEPAPVGGRVIAITDRIAPIAECGTLAGSRRHRHLREPTCTECLAAERAYQRERKALARARAREEAHEPRAGR